MSLNAGPDAAAAGRTRLENSRSKVYAGRQIKTVPLPYALPVSMLSPIICLPGTVRVFALAKKASLWYNL